MSREEKLKALVEGWRESADGFARNQTVGRNPRLGQVKLQEGWKEALRSCAEQLEKVLDQGGTQARLSDDIGPW